jgi:hypothetical protein
VLLGLAPVVGLVGPLHLISTGASHDATGVVPNRRGSGRHRSRTHVRRRALWAVCAPAGHRRHSVVRAPADGPITLSG